MSNPQKLILFLIVLLAIFLRIYQLDNVPPSLFSDEVDIGYQAYSILKTGRDYHGNFLPVHFQSFADFRAPLYIYSVVPAVAALGLNEWAVRIPAAVFGVISIVGIYFLTRVLGFNVWIGLIASLLLSISPWHFHYSRAAFEVTLMISFLIWGVVSFLAGLKNRPLLILSAISLSLAAYSYNTVVLFIPLFTFSLIIIFRKNLKVLPSRWKVAVLVTLFILALPLLVDVLAGKGAYRFSYINIFADPTVASEINFQRAIDDTGKNNSLGRQASFVSKISHNKLLSYQKKFIDNYLSSFSTNFLFIRGDPIGRHSLGKMGELYWPEILTIAVGLSVLFKKVVSEGCRKVILAWILLAPIPASLTVEGGNHATRLFLLLPPLTALSSIGFYYLIKFLSRSLFKKIIFLLFLTFFLVQVYTYFHHYLIHYSSEQERSWNYGFKQAISEANQLTAFDKVVITQTNENPLMFLLFWTGYDPKTFQQGIEKVELTNFGQKVPKLGKYYLADFDQKIKDEKSWATVIDPKMLVITNRSDIRDDLRTEKITGLKVVDIIEYPSGEVAFYLLTRQ